LPYLTAQLSEHTPAVVTFHNYYDNTEDIFAGGSKSFNVALSKSFHAQIPVKFFATVYNGVSIKDFTFNPTIDSQKIVWIGRFSPVKGVDTAMSIANKLKMDLVLAGQAKETDYFTKTIMPAVKKSKYIDFIGPVAGAKRSRTLGDAKLFINPIQWEEPFGLVVPEANACGTPVVAYARGAMPELIEDGVNGFLVKPGDENGMIKAVKKIYDMPAEEYKAMRQRCREHVEKNFTVEKMVDGYEKVYEKVIKDWKAK
jgi:glycosyltransferase involved in cell wall biosynthesis